MRVLETQNIDQRIRSLVNSELDRAARFWNAVGDQMMEKALNAARADSIETDIPGFPTIDTELGPQHVLTASD